MIIDEIEIYCKAGRGGEGCSSMQKLSARRVIGCGGNGGKGGSVVVQVNPHPYDLRDYRGKKDFFAAEGERGANSNKNGKDAQDLILFVPQGTIIRNTRGDVIFDLEEKDSEFVLCRGGRGGEGNFKRNYTLPPQEGEEARVVLDYRIPAQVVVVGFANSGKTSLFNRLTGKNFKVAQYPFTTTSCICAQIKKETRSVVLMDTPPLKKSRDSLEVSNYFLKHLYRAEIVLLLSQDPENYKADFDALRREISLFDKTYLDTKKIFYLLTKIDKIDKVIEDNGIYPVSVQNNAGIELIQDQIFSLA